MPVKTIKKGMKTEKKKEIIGQNIGEQMRKHPERSREQNIAVGFSISDASKKKSKKKRS